MIEIIQLQPSHLPQVVEVFNHYILNSTATFHVTPIDIEEMRIKAGMDKDVYSSFALFDDGVFVGYSTLRPWKPQEAYRHTAEVAVYLHPEHLGRGIGKQALTHLQSVALEKDIRTLIAGICAENDRSVRLFTRSGYEQVGYFKRIGNKFDRELDVVYLQKRLTTKGSMDI